MPKIRERLEKTVEEEAKVEVSTSFYKSINSTEDDIVRINFLKGKDVTRLEETH